MAERVAELSAELVIARERIAQSGNEAAAARAAQQAADAEHAKALREAELRLTAARDAEATAAAAAAGRWQTAEAERQTAERARTAAEKAARDARKAAEVAGERAEATRLAMARAGAAVARLQPIVDAKSRELAAARAGIVVTRALVETSARARMNTLERITSYPEVVRYEVISNDLLVTRPYAGPIGRVVLATSMDGAQVTNERANRLPGSPMPFATTRVISTEEVALRDQAASQTRGIDEGVAAIARFEASIPGLERDIAAASVDLNAARAALDGGGAAGVVATNGVAILPMFFSPRPTGT